LESGEKTFLEEMNKAKNKRVQKYLDRIVAALDAGGRIYRSKSMENVRVRKKRGGDAVTDAELQVNQLLREMLVQDGDGWLSEEDVDNEDRLQRSRIWIVDPLDGTSEYVAQLPEWCISIALMEDGGLVAAGIFNPQTDELIYGSREIGVVCRSGRTPKAEIKVLPREALVLASRSEVKRGEWKRFSEGPFQTLAVGSVAYKLALVAAGKADATWTLVPKNEWDVAAGVALLQFAQGHSLTTEGLAPTFNRKNPLFPGLIGFSAAGLERLRPFLKCVVEGKEFRDCLPWARPFAALNSEIIRSGIQSR
jgi:myo-inositol-1(or 4)-monophosphatase